METTVYERDGDYMSTDDVATLLVKLYADYKFYNSDNEDYARAVAIAARMLND